MPDRTSKTRKSLTVVYRAFDNQRVHFANLQSQAAEEHFAAKRDITKATMEANIVQQSEKLDREWKLKADEQAQDRYELEVARQTRQQYVNSSDMLKY